LPVRSPGWRNDRSTAISISRSVRNLEVSGPSGSQNQATNANRHVGAPSTMNKILHGPIDDLACEMPYASADP
jgi:hypothetical protein